MRTWRPSGWMIEQEDHVRGLIERGKRPHGAMIKDYKSGRMLELQFRQNDAEFMDSKFRLKLPKGDYLVLDKEEFSHWFRYV